MAARTDGRLAAEYNKTGLKFYETWELEKAITAFKTAAAAKPENPEYHLNLARAYARSGDFGQAMHALGDYLHYESQGEVATRYERMFSSALDGVELALTNTLPNMNLTLPQIGKALQMWLEYRIVVGRRPLRTPQPESWAAAITWAIVKVNMLNLELTKIAGKFGVNEKSLKEKYKALLQTLDLMPADYRYYLGEDNPLDQVVAAGESEEANQLLSDLERRFKNG